MNPNEIISKTELLNSFAPPFDTASIRAEIKKELYDSNICIAVLDDDPTGIQTVHDINVYINMDKADIDSAVKNERVFFVQTNTRGLSKEAAKNANITLADKLCAAADKYGRELHIISRSDSTLRGHYPLETDTLRRAMVLNQSRDIDGEILAPCFFEGGRFTANGIHYVADGDTLTPAAMTEFAKDTTFAFNNSRLQDYVNEKCGEDVHSMEIPIEMLREGRVDDISAMLINCKNYCRVILNALCYEDIEVFVLALYRAIKKGKRFLYRTAASFVRVMAGIDAKAPLSHDDFMALTKGGKKGIVVVGSHVKKTTMQLQSLLTLSDCEAVEIDANRLMTDDYKAEIESKKLMTERIYNEGKIPVVYTSRAVLTAGSAGENLKLSTTISDRFVEFVDALGITPDFFIAKGGITSSDMATKACRISKAVVQGQALPGIPVIMADDLSRWPGLLYVIFPGNVGGETALKDAVEKILKK